MSSRTDPSKIKSKDFLSFGGRSIVNPEILNTLAIFADTASLGEANETIKTRVRNVGTLTPDKLFSISRFAPLMGRLIGSSIQQPTEDGMPYRIFDAKIFVPNEDPRIKFAVFSQDPFDNPAQSIQEIVIDTSAISERVSNYRQSTRYYDLHQHKWGSAEVKDLSLDESDTLATIKNMASLSLAMFDHGGNKSSYSS